MLTGLKADVLFKKNICKEFIFVIFHGTRHAATPQREINDWKEKCVLIAFKTVLWTTFVSFLTFQSWGELSFATSGRWSILPFTIHFREQTGKFHSKGEVGKIFGTFWSQYAEPHLSALLVITVNFHSLKKVQLWNQQHTVYTTDKIDTCSFVSPPEIYARNHSTSYSAVSLLPLFLN